MHSQIFKSSMRLKTGNTHSLPLCFLCCLLFKNITFIGTHMRAFIFTLAIAMVPASLASVSLAGDLMYGCVTRPACGKLCKLVCETNTLAAVGYGYECDTICIPSPSRPGSKHCDTTCCLTDDIGGCPPRIDFCWYDWFACGCAKPRTIKLLTKYQAEREICSYRWEVVDAESCECVTQDAATPQNPCVYKPAPVDAEVGDVLAVTDSEWSELAPVLTPRREDNSVQVAGPSVPAPATVDAPPERVNIAKKLQSLIDK
jgi:hypothetical protein